MRSRSPDRMASKVPAFSDIIYPMFDFSGGLNTKSTPLFLDRNAVYSLKPNQATILDNWLRTASGGLVTRPGREKVNTTAISPSNGDQTVRDFVELIKADGTSSVLVHIGDGLYTLTSAGVVTKIGSLATANTRIHWAIFKEAAYGVDGTNVPVKWDGTSLTQITQLSSSCIAIASFRTRLWALDGVTLRYSTDNNGSNWDEITYPNNAGSLSIPVTKGQAGTGFMPFWDRLLVTTNQQVFQLFGVTPTTFNLSAINFRYGHEASPYGLLAAGNDVYMLNRRGVIGLSVSMAQSETGDVETDYISGNIEPSWQALSRSGFSNVVAVDDSVNNCLIIICPSSGIRNNIAFVADYYLTDPQGRPTWSRYTNFPFASTIQVSSFNNFPEVLFGGYDGFIYRQTTALTDAITSGTQNIQTVLQYVTDLEQPAFIKTWRHMVLFASTQSGSMFLNTTYDFGATVQQQSFTLPALVGDPLVTVFTIGTSAIGSFGYSSKRIAIPGSGRYATFLFTAAIAKRITFGGFVFYAGLRRVSI